MSTAMSTTEFLKAKRKICLKKLCNFAPIFISTPHWLQKYFNPIFHLTISSLIWAHVNPLWKLYNFDFPFSLRFIVNTLRLTKINCILPMDGWCPLLWYIKKFILCVQYIDEGKKIFKKLHCNLLPLSSISPFLSFSLSL